jgi:hypothetical protein
MLNVVLHPNILNNGGDIEAVLLVLASTLYTLQAPDSHILYFKAIVQKYKFYRRVLVVFVRQRHFLLLYYICTYAVLLEAESGDRIWVK